MSYKFESFIDNYLNKINNIIYKKMDEEIENDEFLDLLTHNRENIPNLLEEEGLNKEYLNNLTQNRREKLKKEIASQIKLRYENKILKSIDENEMIETMFFNNTQISSKEINEYGKNLLKYSTTKDINYLYDFNFLKIAKNNNLSENENTLGFKELLTSAIAGMKTKDKAEFLAKFNVFFEKHLDNPLGEKEIDLIFKKFKETKKEDPEEAKREWIENIINVVNQNSPNSIDIKLNKEGNNINIENPTASGGLFDGFYCISNVNLTEEQIDNLNKINNLEDFYKFREKLDSVTQILINATADHGVGIEKNSVLRHSLANAVIATTLNSYWITTGDDYILDSFLKRDASLKENINMRGAIITAFEKEYPDVISEIRKNNKDNPEEMFNALQKDLTANASQYIKEKLDIQSLAISDYDMKNYLNINQKLIEKEREKYTEMSEEEILDKYPQLNRDLIFQHKNYFAVYFENGVSNKRVLHKDLNFENPLNEMKDHEVVLLMQYSAIAKQKSANGLDLSLSAVHEFFDVNGELRGFSSKINFDNKALSNKKVKIKDIDEFVFHNLLISENASKNNQFFVNNTREVYSAIVSSYLISNNLDNFINDSNNFNKKEILSQIKKQKHLKVFNDQSKDFIVDQAVKEEENTDLKNKISKKEEEISKKEEEISKKEEEISKLESEKEEQKLIAEDKELFNNYKAQINFLDNVLSNSPNSLEALGLSKLNEIVKESNFDIKELISNESKIKDFFNQAEINWRNKDFNSEIDKSYTIIKNKNNVVIMQESKTTNYENKRKKDSIKKEQKENNENAKHEDGYKKNTKNKKIKNK